MLIIIKKIGKHMQVQLSLQSLHSTCVTIAVQGGLTVHHRVSAKTYLQECMGLLSQADLSKALCDLIHAVQRLDRRFPWWQPECVGLKHRIGRHKRTAGNLELVRRNVLKHSFADLSFQQRS